MKLVCRALLMFLLAPGIVNAQTTPAPAPTAGCVGANPFAAMNTGYCVNGGWMFGNPPAPAPTPTPTQTPAPAADDISIYVGGYQLTTNGAEKAAGVSRGVHLRWSMGKPTAAVFSTFGCGNFAVTVPPETFENNAYAGWRVEITPTKVAADHAATFRLRWVRALDKGASFTPIGEDLELTLKPGESRPLDSVAVPTTAKTFDGKPCMVKAGSLRLSVEFDSSDRRLIGADVWLVERLSNGKEDSQLQSVRAMPHQEVPFYFDSISDGTNRFDFYGRLIAELTEGGIQIDVEATRAMPHPGQKGYQAARFFRATIHIKPGEIVDVALTPQDKDGNLVNRVFSLRIRAKQIR
jgi:hypothetical protein